MQHYRSSTEVTINWGGGCGGWLLEELVNPSVYRRGGGTQVRDGPYTVTPGGPRATYPDVQKLNTGRNWSRILIMGAACITKVRSDGSEL